MSTRFTLFLLLAAVLCPADTRAQRFDLTVTGLPLTFSSPMGADFVAGSIQAATTTTFTVDQSTGPNDPRQTSVYIRCGSPCASAGAKAVAALQWRRADQGTWNSLTTTNTLIESRTVTRNSQNDPWSNSILWRFLLNWDTDLPGTMSTYNVVFTVMVTAP